MNFSHWLKCLKAGIRTGNRRRQNRSSYLQPAGYAAAGSQPATGRWFSAPQMRRALQRQDYLAGVYRHAEQLEDRTLLTVTLAAGDLAVVGWNSGGTDGFAVVALADIPGGSVVFFTDDGWQTPGFGQDLNDSHIRWVVGGGGVTAGTVLTDSTLSSHGTVTFETGGSLVSSLDLNAAGDATLIYQTTDDNADFTGTNVTFISGFNNSNFGSVNGWNTGSTASTSSDAPTGLTVVTASGGAGEAFGLLNEANDSYVYNGPTTAADKATWQTRLNTVSNWLGQDGASYDISPGGGNLSASYTVSGGNTAPTVSSAPADIAVTEDISSDVDLSATTFADSDGDSLTVTLSVDSGTFNTPADGSGVGAGVTETLVNSTTITLQGFAADINTYLDTASNIQYTGASNVSGNDAATLTITPNDGTTDGTAAMVNIDITAVNDAPVLDNSQSPTLTAINEDAGDDDGSGADGDDDATNNANNGGDTVASIVVDASITDVDGSPVEAIAVTIVDNTNGVWQYSLDGGTSWNNFSGTTGSSVDISSAARLLNPTHRIRFVPDANYSGTATFTFRAWDQSSGSGGGTANTASNGGTTAFSSASDTASVTINPVNDAPAFFGLDGTPVFNAGGPAVTLDSDVTVSDIELDALSAANGDYAGASLTIARNGGANADDSFSFDTALALFMVNGSNLQSGGQTFATFTNSGGTLTVNFTSSATAATSALVDDVLQRVQYENTSGSPPAMAQLDWTFSDGNSGNAQGTGANPGTDTGSTTVSIVIQPTSVQSVNPAADSRNAAVNTNVTATFDGNIDNSTVTDQTFVVHSTLTGQLLSGNGDITSLGSGDTATITLDPANDFHAGEIIQVTATSGLLDTPGGDGVAPYVWQFRTGTVQSTGVFASTGQNIGAFSTYDVEFGDLDGDGDLDMVLVPFLGFTQVFVNDGSGTFTNSLQNLGGNVQKSGLALGDIDGDGDLDIWEAAVNTGDRILLNDGSGVFSDSGQSLNASLESNVALGDLDGDGDLDAFISGSGTSPNKVWINQGGTQAGTIGTFSDSGQSFGNFNDQDVALADIDGDGDFDAITSAYGGANVYRNDGSGTFSTEPRVGGGNGLGIAVGDVDGDGDVDLFVSRNGASNKLFLNDGAGSFSDSGQSFGSGGRQASLGDVDGDGDLDLAIAHNGSNKLWLNQGGAQGGTLGNFSDSGQTIGSGGTLGIELADLDGDGDLDLYEGNYLSAADHVYLNLNPETEITLSSGMLTITDVQGGTSNDNLTISYSGGVYTITDTGGLLLDARSIAGSTGYGTSTVTVPDTGVAGILFDVLGGDDSVTVTSVQTSFSGNFTITGGTGTDTATINGDVATTGMGAINVTVSQNILLGSGASLTTVDGGITLSANASGTGAGNFVGIELDNADITTTGDGNISLTGFGGDDAGTGDHYGVHLQTGSTVSSSGTGMNAGTITITGSGGNGTSNNFGIHHVAGAGFVRSVDGDIMMIGTGGSGSGSFNRGILINSSAVTSTGTTADAASISILGNGGAGSVNSQGISIASSLAQITTVAGDLTVTGTGGTGGAGNVGVALDAGAQLQVTTGTLSVTGTAGSGASDGLRVAGFGPKLRSVDAGAVTLTGTASGSGSDIALVGLADTTLIGGPSASGAITINANSIDSSGAGAKSIQGTGTLTIQPRTASTTIGLGGGSGILNLDDTELGFLQDGFSSITIGSAASGDIDVNTATFSDPLTLITGGEIHDAAAGTDLTLGAGDAVTIDGTLAPGQSPGIAAIDGDVNFADGSVFEVEIGGTSPGTASTDHDQLSVSNGSVTIGTGVALNVLEFNGFGSSVLPGHAFTIIDVVGAAETVTGTFTGLGEGAAITNFLGSGMSASITYAGGDGNDVVLTVQPPPTFSKAFSPDAIIVNQVSTLTFTIDNSASTLAATGLDFTDNLPAGVQIATPANASTTATGGTLTAVSGTGTISYTGGSVGAGISATVTVDVIATMSGVFVNTSGDLTSSLGNSGIAADTLTANTPDTGVTLSGGTLTVTDVDGGTSNDDLTISYAGGTYTITDGGGLILDASSIAGSTGTGTSTVTVPDTGVTGILFDVLGGDDDVTVDSVQASLSGNFTITGGTGTDSVAINGAIDAGGGSLNITAEAITTSASLTGNGGISLTTDSLAIGANVSGSGTLVIEPQTVGATIGLGGGSGTLNLDDTELAFLQDGFSAITIGDVMNGTGAVDIGSSTFSDNVTIAGGSIAVTELDAGSNTVALTARTGSVTDGGDAGTDVTGGAVTLNSAGTIGASGDGLSLAATSLTADSSAADGGQFLSETDLVSVTSLDAGNGTVTISGGTFNLGSGTSIGDGTTVDVQTGATLDVNGQTETLTQVTVSGGSLIGTGTLNAPVTATSGSVAPGNSTGVIATGNLNLGAGSSFDVELNSPYAAAGADYDQLDVTGSVTLGATLNLTGGAVAPAGGESVIIVNNDGADAVSGTFAGLAEGDPVSVGSFAGTLTYQGGDGNDVALVVTGPFTVDGTSGDDDFEVRRVSSGGADLIQVLRGGVVVDSRPTDTVTMVTINGDDGDDTLTVNYFGSGGFFTAPIAFNGNGQTSGDDIVILGGSVDTVTHQFDNDNDGNFTVELGGQSQTTTYTGLEPVTDNLNATDRVFTFTGGGETIALSDDGGAGNGMSLIDSTLGESVAFVNPSGSLTINAGSGSDTVNLTGLDSTFDADLSVNGDGTASGGAADVNVSGDLDVGAGTVTIGGDGNVSTVSLNGGSLTTTGNVSVAATGAMIDGDATVDITAAGLLLSAGGSIGITSVDPLETTIDNLEVVGSHSVTIDETDDLTIGGVDGGTNGLSSTDVIMITAGGLLTVDEDVTTDAGTFGDISIRGAVSVSATVAVSALDDSVFLTGNDDGDDDAVIGGTLTADRHSTIRASRDVLISGLVQTMRADGDIDIESDFDSDGGGGARVTAAGQLVAGDGVDIEGSALSDVVGSPIAVEIEDDGANLQIDSGDTVRIFPVGGMLGDAAVVINGAIQGTAGNSSVFITSNGDVQFGPNGDLAIPNALAGVGFLGIMADENGNGSGGIVMDDDAQFDSGASDVELRASEDILLGGVLAGRDIEIETVGAVLDGGDGLTDLTAGRRLQIDAGAGVGTAADPLETAVGQLTVDTDSGDIQISNSTALSIEAFRVPDGPGRLFPGLFIRDDFDFDSAGEINVTANGALTLNGSVINDSAGAITLTVSDSAGTGDDLTINEQEIDLGVITPADITTNGGVIMLNVGDDFSVTNATSTISTTDDIIVNLDSGNADGGTGATGTFDGTWTGNSLTINGDADADTIDASAISLAATFNGNGGNDTITGTSGNDTMIGGTGDDMLDGDAGDDLFQWSDGDDSDTIEGGADSDLIELVAGTVTDVDYIFVNNSDGSIAVDAQTITYTGLEPIIDNLDATNRSFSYTGGAETITLSDDGMPGDGVSMIDSTLGEVVMFVHPTSSLTIDAGDGDDTVDLAGLDSTFAGSITVNGGADSDTVSVSGDINANGGTISVGEGGDVESVSFDGGALITSGDVTVFSTGAIADNDAGNDVTADTVALRSGTGVGSGANALDTTVNAVEADGGTGGVWVSDTGDLTVDDINATLNGVTATGDIELTSGGRIRTFGMLDSNGGNIRITAVDDVVILNDVASDGGDITFNSDSDGIGGGGIAVDGVFGSAVVTSSGGNIVLGGGADPTMNPAVATAFVFEQGVAVDDGTLNAGTGDILIRGSSALSDDAVDFSNGAVVTTTSGSITVIGDSTGDDDGVDIDSGSVILTTSGAITITGTASGGTADEGVTFDDAGTLVTTESGQITITGTGDNGEGIEVIDGAVVSSTGASASGITLNGTATGIFQAGILIAGTDAAVTAVSGAIQISGGNVNDLGVFIGDGASVSSTGTGATAATISIDGTGAFGVYAFGSGQAVSSIDGDITINGTSTGAEGVLVENAVIESTGTGAAAANIAITGTSTNVDGVAIVATGSVEAVDGTVQITGDGNLLGIYVNGSVQSDTGEITLTVTDSMATGDGIGIDMGGQIQSTTGNVNLQAGDDVVIASGATVGTGGLVVVDGDFGDADAGVGSTIDIIGTISQAIIRGQGDNDVITLDPDATTGSLLIDGQAGDDQYNIQVGNLGGQVDIDDQAGAGTDEVNVAGTGGDDTVSVDPLQIMANTTQIITYTANLETVNVDGGDGADAFDVTPSTTAEINILGSDPATIPGDSLTYNAPAGESVTFSPSDPDTGTISATGGFQNVNYDLVEEVTIDGAAGGATLVVNGSAEDDVFDVDFDGGDSGSLDITLDSDGMPGPTTTAAVSFASIQTVQINAGDGDDLLQVTDPADGVSGSLDFNGQGDSDSIVLVSGTATTLTHNFDNATDGSIDTDGAIINYTGLEPITDNIDANNRVFTFAATDDDITVSDLGGGMSRIESVSSSETVDFANPTTTLTVNGGDGNDTIDASALAFDVTLNGGAGNDSLIGTNGFDRLNGDAGNDMLDGGTSNDTLSGGDNDDLIVWNNGDGSDLVDGDAGTDTLEVNASASGDDFSIDPNGSRFVLTRNNLGLFSLDVGTVETLDLNTFAGADTLTVGDLSGVSDLTTLDIDGGDDNDTIDLQGLTGGPVAQLDGGDGDDTVRASTGPEGGDGAADDLNLGVNGMSGTLDYTVNATLVFRATPSAGADQVIINGSSDDDALTLDFANGSPVAPGGLFFNGGGQQTGGDNLTLINGTVTTVTHNFTNTSDGTIEIEDSGTETVTYTGLNIFTPISDSLSTTNRIFNYDAVDDIISLSDLGGGASRIESPISAATVDFVNPVGSLVVNAGDGADSLAYASIDTPAAVTLNMGDGDDFSHIFGTTAGSVTTVNGDAGNDVIGVGAIGGLLDSLLGDVTISGGDHDASPTVGLGGRVLPLGDQLFVFDFGNTAGVSFGVTESTISRSGAATITYGTTESLQLDAGSGDDTIAASTTADAVNTTLNGGSGADSIMLTTTGAGANVKVDGEGGDDTISYAATGTGSATALLGGEGNDTVTGTGSGDNVQIVGGVGDDSLTGGSGDDAISGGDDSDTITGGQGADSLDGSDGDDVFVWNDGDGNDRVDGEAGTDRQIVNAADNAAEGDSITVSDNGARIDITRAAGTMLGTFTLDVGTTEIIEVNSLAGDDTIDASGLTNGRMHVNAGDGVDTITGGSQNDTLSGNGGGDSIDGGDGDDTIRGGAGSDTLNGQAGNDLVEGQGSSGDRLTGETGDDTLDGGMGTDTVVETADQDFDLGDSSLVGMITGNDTLVDVEQALLTGGASANVIDASDFNGSATLVGLAGADTITGGSIVDLIYGGDGNDIISANGGGDIIHGQGGNDSVLGGDGNDTIRGSAGRDTLRGDAGDDMIFGQGSSGDILQGGTGNDTLDGGAGNDRVFEEADTDFVLIDGQLTGGTTGVDVLIAIENAQLIGGVSDNSIDASGFSGFATLSGAAGDDSIIAAAGGSIVNGDAGADSLLGSQVADTINGGDGDDTVNAQDGNDIVNGGDGNDLINGSLGADTVNGDAGNDRILGSTNADYLADPIQPLDLNTVNNTDNDSLLGNDGDDTIVGALGSDFVNGGDGADVIDVTSGGDGLDGIDTVAGTMLDAIFSDPTDLLI